MVLSFCLYLFFSLFFRVVLFCSCSIVAVCCVWCLLFVVVVVAWCALFVAVFVVVCWLLVVGCCGLLPDVVENFGCLLL